MDGASVTQCNLTYNNIDTAEEEQTRLHSTDTHSSHTHTVFPPPCPMTPSDSRRLTTSSERHYYTITAQLLLKYAQSHILFNEAF